MKRLVMLVAVVMALAVATASAAVTFKLGPTFNMFGNKMLSGIGNQVGIAFDLDKTAQIGIRMEQQNLVVTDPDASINNNRLSNQLTLLTFDKDVANITKELPVTVGFELGQVCMESLAGTTAAVPALNQVAPVVGINGGLKYEIAGKVVTTALLLNIGYRLIDINDCAIPVIGATQSLKDLSGLRVDIGLAVTF